MRRRDFIVMAGSAAATWPFATRAQQRERLPRVGVLEPIAKETPSAQSRYTAFLQAFERLGWVDGRNVQIVARWSGGNSVELRKYAEELAALAPDVVLAGGGTGAEAMLKVTRAIPIVFAIVPDPVGASIVEIRRCGWFDYSVGSRPHEHRRRIARLRCPLLAISGHQPRPFVPNSKVDLLSVVPKDLLLCERSVSRLH